MSGTRGGQGEQARSPLSTTPKKAFKRVRSCSYVTLALFLVGSVSLAIGIICVFVRSNDVLSTLRKYADMVPVPSEALVIVGIASIAVAIAFEVFDRHRRWHRPRFRVKGELRSALKSACITTASPFGELGLDGEVIDGLRIDRYRWHQAAYSVTLRVIHAGNAKLTLDSLRSICESGCFRFAQSCEVEPYMNRRGYQDGYLVTIYYKPDSETLNRQLRSYKNER